MRKKWTKYKHILLFIVALLSTCWCLFFSVASIPIPIPIALAKAPKASEWQVVSAFDLNLLRLLAKAHHPDQDGAVGHNQQGYISVAFQRYSSEPIIYGVETKNVRLIETGVRAFEYAFAHQNPDGSFPYNPPHAVSTPTAADIASPVAGFYSDFGHSLLLLQDCEWFQKSEETANLRLRLNQLLKPATTSLIWLMGQQAALRHYDLKTTNLLFLDAAAYYFAGKALKHSDAVKLGESFTRLALQQQTEVGFFWEKGGYDSSYQSVSLRLALWLYANLQSGAVSLKRNLWIAIEKGIGWELTRILPTGEVLTEGNARVYSGGEKYFSKEKGVDYIQVILALNYYSKLSGDLVVQRVADQVLTFKRESGNGHSRIQ